MKLICSIVLICIIAITGCSKPQSASNNECIEPNNSYDIGTGHYAGFEWAQENGRVADSNSESFNEGSEVYIRQLEEYNECKDKYR